MTVDSRRTHTVLLVAEAKIANRSGCWGFRMSVFEIWSRTTSCPPELQKLLAQVPLNHQIIEAFNWGILDS
jgi:hypothetical protein